VSLLVVVVLLAIFAVLVALRRNERRGRLAQAATVEVVVDDAGVTRRLADGREEAVRWDEVVEVEVLTTKVGVHKGDGVVLVLGADAERGCLVPSKLAVEHGVVERIAALPGFDVGALSRAMELAPPSRTSVWVRPGTSGPAGGPAAGPAADPETGDR
jgi:hypothetical protein